MAKKQILADKTGRDHIIEIKDLCKSFGDQQVLKNITFYIRNNEFITLLGPSGVRQVDDAQDNRGV
jgi:ABC-type spermidine/putrescine transport systems, ATPase components